MLGWLSGAICNNTRLGRICRCTCRVTFIKWFIGLCSRQKGWLSFINGCCLMVIVRWWKSCFLRRFLSCRWRMVVASFLLIVPFSLFDFQLVRLFISLYPFFFNNQCYPTGRISSINHWLSTFLRGNFVHMARIFCHYSGKRPWDLSLMKSN